MKEQNYFLFDGAFGTYYAEKFGGEIPCELANLRAPQQVEAIHREYLLAGAKGIKTNTFAANPFSLGMDFEGVREVIAAGWKIAQKVTADTGAVVFADIGPIPSETPEDFSQYEKIVREFIGLGAKHFLFETMPDGKILQLAGFIKDILPTAKVIVSFAVGQDGYTLHGVPAAELMRQGEASAADALGFNCICGPAHLLGIISGLSDRKKDLFVSPNAGYPSMSGGRIMYLDNPAYFAGKLLEMKNAGAVYLGGCCGTTPEHIRAAAKALSGESQPLPRVSKSVSFIPQESSRNPFEEKLRMGQKVIAVELDPPLDTDFSHIREAAPYLRDCGADAITLADSPLARPRADSMLISAKVQREFGIEAIPHMTCRDHNTIGLKSALLAGSIEGIRNVLIVTGDSIPAVERNDVKGVFSANSYQLTRFVSHLNEDVFSGKEFYLGGALNINAENFEYELKRAQKKEENGTKFLMTQPIFSKSAKENLILARKTLSIKLLAGIMPIVSYKNGVFLNNEVSGIHVPEELLSALKDKTPEQAREISLEFALNVIREVSPYCDGYYFMTPLKKYQWIGELVRRFKNMQNEKGIQE